MRRTTLYALEQLWRRTRRVEDEAALLAARVRYGTLSVGQVELASALGHPAARDLLEVGLDPRVPPARTQRVWSEDLGDFVDRPLPGDELRVWAEGLARWGQRTCLRVGLAANLWAFRRVANRIVTIPRAARSESSLAQVPLLLAESAAALDALERYRDAPCARTRAALEPYWREPSPAAWQDCDDPAERPARRLQGIHARLVGGVLGARPEVRELRGHDPERRDRWALPFAVGGAVEHARVGLRPGEPELALKVAIRRALLGWVLARRPGELRSTAPARTPAFSGGARRPLRGGRARRRRREVALIEE